MSKRLAIVAPTARSLLKNRDGLIREAVRIGHRVLCIAPSAGEAAAALIEALGAETCAVTLDPPGLRFLANRKAQSQLTEALAAWRPDVVLSYGSRPLVLGALAGRRASARRIISLVNGLPEHGLTGSPDEHGMSSHHYARAFKASDAIVVHNTDDVQRLKDSGTVPEGLSIVVVPGAGVDLEHHKMQPLPPLGDGLVFLMISRLGHSQGAGEYAAAARKIKAHAPSARFLLAGPQTNTSAAVSLEALGVPRTIDYLGDIDDVRTALSRAHVYVHPAHAEGMPRAVLEALAAGRPVITTSTPGCRETVDERVNGCLVPPGDSNALASAMESFLKRPDLIPAMARASRTKAERRFDARDVNQTMLSVLGLA